MEFWGVEVKPGQSLKVTPELYKLIHISQASLGEYKEGKGPKNVTLKLKIGGKDFVIGSLAGEERSQLMFDLVCEKEFELSHGWKNGSVFFLGYVADDQGSDEEEDYMELPEDISEDELVPVPENGDAKPKPETVPAAKKDAALVKEDEPVSDDSDDSDSDDEDDDEIDSDDLMGSSDEEEEDVPQAQPAKKNAKRPAESPKEAAPAKKNKSEQKASPLPAKNSGGKPQQGSSKKPQGGNKSPQGGNKFNGQKQGGNKGQKGKVGGQRK